MEKSMLLWSFVVIFLASFEPFLVSVCSQQIGDALTYPRMIESSGGLLDIELTIEYADHSNAAITLTNTRLFDGSMPGPTLVLSAGDTMKILFKNELEEQAGAASGASNTYGIPDDSNLHFHGAHVSGELPSDDVRLHVEPGEYYQYETHFPDNHHPGTHWIHPHVHGSSSVQVGGGAALVMIVRDPEGYLPSLVENAPDHVLLVQTMNQGTLESIVEESGDSKFTMSQGTDNSARPVPREYRMVNGMYQPTLTMTTGQWTRWRIVNAGWLRDPLDLTIDSTCDMVLLAKDGIYVSDFPRDVSLIATPTGGRADVMVRCSTEGSYDVTDGFSQTVWTVSVNQGSNIDADFESWAPNYPEYLTDLRAASIDNGCSCSTAMQQCDSSDGEFCVNNNSFDAEEFIHEVAFDSTVERILSGVDNHPYHQHVYPFQIHDNVDDDSGLSEAQKAYFKEGDWHDVLMIDNLDARDLPVRYKADVHDGRIMLHCHRLNHEDLGMMAMENVVDGGSCQCNALSVAAAVPNVTPNPTDSPISSPTTNPTSLPTSSPTRSPTKSPTQSPSTGAPVDSSTTAPISSPTTTGPTLAPTSGPTQSPSQRPSTLAPVNSGTTAPVSPTASPLSPPTVSPTSTAPTSSPAASPTGTQRDRFVRCFSVAQRDILGQILPDVPPEQHCITSERAGSVVTHTVWNGLNEGFDITSFAADFIKELHRAMDIAVGIPDMNSCTMSVNDMQCTSCSVCDAIARTVTADCRNVPQGRVLNCEPVSPFLYPLIGETAMPTQAPATSAPSMSPVTSQPTRSPVAPTPSPVSPTPPSSTNEACFSSGATIEVQGKGRMRMDQLEIGDFVLAGRKKFSQVHSFYHIERDVPHEYISIRIENHEEPLEISHNHLIFVGNGEAMPAGRVKTGDKIGDSFVTGIDKVKRYGIYAPATFSGDIVVSGVLVSTYSSHLPNALINEHTAAHVLLTYHRMACRIQFTWCENETYSEFGISNWIVLLTKLVRQLDTYAVPAQILVTLLAFPLMLCLFAWEMLYFHALLVCLGAFTLSYYFGNRWQKAKFSKQP